MFSARTGISNHTDWLEGAIELVTLVDGPPRLGTPWKHIAVTVEKTYVSSNVSNAFEPNRKFGGKSGKSFTAQVTFVLEPARVDC